MKTSAFAILAAATAVPFAFAQDASGSIGATTPGGVNHSTQPSVPLPEDTSSAVDSSTGSFHAFTGTFSGTFVTTTTANYSTSLTVPTTTTTTTTTTTAPDTTATTTTTTTIETTSTTPVSASSSTTPDALSTSIVVVTPSNGGAPLTSTRVIVLPPPSQAPAASTTPGQLANGAERLQNGVQVAAMAGLVAVCGIMGML